MRQRLYYDNAYITEFTARIVEQIDSDTRHGLVLDRTYFYPTGGGQPNDLGTLNGIAVIDVFTRDSDHAIIHLVQEPPHAEIVTGMIDWDRRFDFMQQHTGQHILTQGFVSEAKANTIGFHLSQNSVTIDLDTPNITHQTIDRVEVLVNKIVQENRPVTARILEPEEAEQLGARIRRIPGHLATGGLRVIEVQDFDLTACGGTHVAHTGEIGLIKVLKAENYKGGTRIEFACGGRALSDYRQRYTVTSEIASMLTLGLSDIPAAVERLRTDLKAAQSDLKRARTALLDLEMPAMLAEAQSSEGYRLIIRAFDDREASDVRALASKLVQQEGVIALLGAAGDKSMIFCARSADLPHDMNTVLKSALVQFGEARGGGKADFAQGGGIPAALDQVNTALIAASQTLTTSIQKAQ